MNIWIEKHWLSEFSSCDEQTCSWNMWRLKWGQSDLSSAIPALSCWCHRSHFPEDFKPSESEIKAKTKLKDNVLLFALSSFLFLPSDTRSCDVIWCLLLWYVLLPQLESGAIFYEHQIPEEPFWATKDTLELTLSSDVRLILPIAVSFSAAHSNISSQLWTNRGSWRRSATLTTPSSVSWPTHARAHTHFEWFAADLWCFCFHALYFYLHYFHFFFIDSILICTFETPLHIK